jgi:pyruvate dehydrogenase E2 component (dihydrolipoamide acetyltransferase)
MADIVNMPKLGFDMAEGVLVRWVVLEDEEVQKGQVLAEIETDKATVEVESTYAGVVRRHLVEEGAIVPVSTPIAVIGKADEQINFDQLIAEPVEQGTAEVGDAVSRDPIEQPESIQVPEGDDGAAFPSGVRASPLARRMAEELGIDLRNVNGSGPGGRIVKADLEAFQAAPQVSLTPEVIDYPSLSLEVPEDHLIPLSKLRVAIGKRMVQSKQEFPQFFVTHEYDVDDLMEFRSQVNAVLPEDEKTSVNDYIVKGVARTLREFPNLNAKLNEDNGSVVQFGHINIGVAVAVENGLLTVVCRDADLKSIRQISKEIRSMANRAREGKVKAEDIEGSTFSVSNLGMFEVEEFIAIINPPEAAILAVGSVNRVPVIKEDQVVPGWRMKTTISVDHRVSDGAEAAQFLQALARYLEEPLRLVV